MARNFMNMRSLFLTAVLLIGITACIVPVAASPAGMQVYSIPSGANACLDGWWWQTTPATFENIGNGYHMIQVNMEGYQPYSYSTSVSDGTEVVNANLIRNTPTPGYLDIKSEPNGADVYIDGAYYGNAPMVIGNLWSGTHQLQVKKAGYYDITDTFPITSDSTWYYNAVLNPYPAQPEFGSLQIDSTPGGAAIFLNGNYMGNTPSSGVFYITQLSPGSYALRIVMQDYQPYTESAVVRAGIINDIHATLNPVAPGPVPDTTGQILVYSTPSGANVYLDNAYKGITPLTLTNIPTGSHTVTFRLNGYQDLVKPAIVVGGSTTEAPGALVQSSNPPPNPQTPVPQPTKSPISLVSIISAIGICGAAAIQYRKSG